MPDDRCEDADDTRLFAPPLTKCECTFLLLCVNRSLQTSITGAIEATIMWEAYLDNHDVQEISQSVARKFERVIRGAEV